MSLSPIHETLASNSYGKIAQICDELMLEVASRGVALEQDWPYAIHLLGHIFADDLNSARFLWKLVPAGVKETDAEVVAVWKIGQCLWTRDYAGVYAAVRGFEWRSPDLLRFVTAFADKYSKKMFQLLCSAYSTISVADTAHFMGMNEQDATNYALQNDWTLDQVSQMLTVKRSPIAAEQKVERANLHRLTEYVFHLEH